MPVDDFSGDTFVAFVDISGFKQKLQKNVFQAKTVLEGFYKTGYSTLKENDKIKGFFISDCGILIVDPRNSQAPEERYDDLHTLFTAIKEINKRMLKQSILLTASSAYGYFHYSN